MNISHDIPGRTARCVHARSWLIALALLCAAPAPSPSAVRTVTEHVRALERIRDTMGRSLHSARFARHAAEFGSRFEQLMRAWPDGGDAGYPDWRKHAGYLRKRIDTLRSAAPSARTAAFERFDLWFRTLTAGEALRRATADARPVLLLLSTSVSCECTLEKCSSLAGLLKTYAADPSVRIVICDAYHRSDLQERFNAYFTPTLILLDAKGRERKRFENTVLNPEQLRDLVQGITSNDRKRST